MVYRNSSFSKFLKPSYLNYNFIEIILSFILSISLILFSFFYKDDNTKLRKILIDNLQPVSRVLSTPVLQINILLTKFKHLFEMDEENKKLSADIKNYKKQLGELYYLKIENEKLKKLLSLTAPPSSKQIVARIIFDSSNFLSTNLFIDVGFNDNVKVNNPVFNDSGLIGRIVSVTENSSEVLLITDPKSSLPVLSSDSKQRFFVKGNLNGLEIKHLEDLDKLQNGETILTTSSSGYFKKGIVVGQVKKIDQKVEIEILAKKNDSIFVKVLVYNYRKNQPIFESE